MLRETLEFPLTQLVERIRNWVRQKVAEAVFKGASEGITEALAELEGRVTATGAGSLPPPVLNAVKPASPEASPSQSAVRALPFGEATSQQPAPAKRGRGRPRKHLNHDTDRT